MFQPISESGEAQAGRTYRSTFYLGGPYPPAWLGNSMVAALREAGKRTGRFKVLSTEQYGKGMLPGSPPDTWAFRFTWQKLGTGTPLVFFTGAGGIITLAIVGVVVAVAGVVIVARTLEELVEAVPEAKSWISLALAGGLAALALWAYRK